MCVIGGLSYLSYPRCRGHAHRLPTAPGAVDQTVRTAIEGRRSLRCKGTGKGENHRCTLVPVLPSKPWARPQAAGCAGSHGSDCQDGHRGREAPAVQGAEREKITCVDSIHEAEKKLEFRIYLVDNCSPVRPETGVLESLDKKGVIFIQNERNAGYSAGNNIGIKRALEDGCEEVLISNSDVRYETGSISELQTYLQDHPDVGIVGPKIFLRDGSIQKECMMRKTGIREKYLLRTRFYLFFPRLNNSYWGREHDYESEVFQVYAVMGCCFMFSRKCALDVTPLDENPFLYEEELILGISMEKKGWKTVYDPSSVIHHLHGNSTEKVKAFAYTCNICSEIYFCRQYLNMKKWQILPLYWYRSVLYGLKMLRYQDFRKYVGEYVKRTGLELKKIL